MLGRYDELLPAVDPDDAEAVMPGSEPWSSCGPYAAADTSRRNEVTRGSLHTLMTLATFLHQQK
jgi:hypothetical protein